MSDARYPDGLTGDSTTTRIGKIADISIGFGGYQDAQFGLTVTLASEPDAWAVTSFIGFWSGDPSKHAAWTVSDQDAGHARMCRRVIELLVGARRQRVADLVGLPIQATFNESALVAWRILTEAV